ncbi:MAG: ORF6N domain-containing protein [Acidobacteriia bacterium]|nr:ORF6N domain-containing protein [Terriglobia bacterium]
MKRQLGVLTTDHIENLIYVVDEQRVMMDTDLARIYGVSTKALNQAVRRNKHRFPDDFVFQLTKKEVGLLRSQIVTSNRRGGRRYLPYAFTEHGAIMAANILNSEQAVTMSVFVVRAFIKMREILGGNRKLAVKLAELERNLTTRLAIHEEAIVQLFKEIRELLKPPPAQPESKKRRIGFHRG